MKRPLSHPTVSAVKAIHAEALDAHGGSEGWRDEALLESAGAASQATMMGEPLLTDPVEIAAAYLFYGKFSDLLAEVKAVTGGTDA